jgi:tetratricopeptide (TPR) repeat protein
LNERGFEIARLVDLERGDGWSPIRRCLGIKSFGINAWIGRDAPAGTIVFVRDPDLIRAAVAHEPATSVLSVGAEPGAVYVSRAWELTRDVFALLDAGEADAAKQVLIDALDQYGDRGVLLYRLACAEAQLGEHDAALDHLRVAMIEKPSLAQSAQQDADLKPLRKDTRFLELLGSFESAWRGVPLALGSN